MKLLILFTFGVLIFTACSLLPTNRTQESSLKTSENLGSQNAVLVKHTVEGEKAPTVPNLTVSGASNQVEITVNPARDAALYRAITEVDSTSDQSATSKLSERSKFSMSLPWGIALCATALGILGVTFALKYAIKTARASSVAVDQAFQTGDNFLGEFIRQTRTKMNDAMLAGKQAEAAAHAQSLAEIESQRGKLKAKKVS